MKVVLTMRVVDRDTRRRRFFATREIDADFIGVDPETAMNMGMNWLERQILSLNRREPQEVETTIEVKA